jgi:hypothetical protein
MSLFQSISLFTSHKIFLAIHAQASASGKRQADCEDREYRKDVRFSYRKII